MSPCVVCPLAESEEISEETQWNGLIYVTPQTRHDAVLC